MFIKYVEGIVLVLWLYSISKLKQFGVWGESRPVGNQTKGCPLMDLMNLRTFATFSLKSRKKYANLKRVEEEEFLKISNPEILKPLTRLRS